MIEAPLNKTRSPLIDLLRACLAIWVLCGAHLIPWAAYMGQTTAPMGFAQWLISVFQPAGELHPAVLCFIVLSGYCIHRNGLRTGGVLPYAVRRFFRIYPVYLLASVFGIACFTIAVGIAPNIARALLGTPAIEPHCVLARLSLLSAIAPSVGGCSFQGNAPLDTVMVEMVLYAIYPLLLLGLARRLGEWSLWIVVLGVWAYGMVLVSSQPSLHSWWQNSTPISFLVFWWVGAKFLDRGFARVVTWLTPLLLVAWLALTWAILNHQADGIIAPELRKMAMALLFGVLVVRVDNGLQLPAPLALVGKAGYSIYAFHAPLLIVLLLSGVPWWLAAIAAVGLGILSYTVVERPCIRIGRSLAGHQIVTRTRKPAVAS
jgi:peptidoglycan/LPS O-acetylase OafA/YrhL